MQLLLHPCVLQSHIASFSLLRNLTASFVGLSQQAVVAQGVPSRLRPRIFLTFGTTRVVGRQPYAPAAFTPGEIPVAHYLEAESTPGHMVLSVATEKTLQ
jgi:hypothetical protein